MRRLSAGTAALVLVALLALALLPTLAYAADDGQSSYAGTYMGLGDGKDKNGKTGSSMVTIWVEDLGDTARITFQVDKLDVTAAAEGTEQWSGDSEVTVPITIDQYGVSGTGQVTFTRDGDTWTLTATGNGKTLKYEGDGQAPMSRISTGIQVPSLGQQIKDMFKAITDGPPKAEDSTTPPAEGQVESQAKEYSSLAPAEAAPPVPTAALVMALSLSIFTMLFFLLLCL